MKKFLSLVLSLAMTLSLVTISASATDYKDLSDKGEIKYEEAVAVLNKLGIITGYEDGSFKPTGSLTRGAAAKIIVSLEIGAEAASALTVAAAPYKDVPVTNTFAAVISYCKTQGYINGYNDGTFRPTAALSGFAFAKMLLGAVGYRGDIEKFTGSGWTMNVAKLGKQAGLFDDFATEFAGGPNVDRESACLLALNTLKATEVEYTANGNNLNVNDKGNIVGASTNYTRDYVTSRNDNINKNISKEKSGNDSSYYTLEFGEEHFQDLKLTKDGSGEDDFGRPSNEWTYKNVKIGTYPVSADYKYTSAPDGDTNVDEVKDMNLDDFYFDKNTTLTVNGKDCSNDKDFGIEVGKTTTTKNAKMFDHYTTDGVLVEVYLDDDNADTIQAVVVIKTQMMQISSVQSDKVTLKKIEDDKQNTTSLDFMPVTSSIKKGDDGYDVLKDLKADDYVLIVPVLDSGSSYKVFSAAVPQTVKGVITSYATKSNNQKVKSITVAGTTYKMSTMWTSEDGDLNAGTILSKTQESTVYLDSYGYAIFVSDVQDSNNAIVIDEIYSSVVDGKIVKYAKGWSTSGDELSINLGTSPKYPDGTTDDSAQQGKTYEYVSSTSNSADYKLMKHATTWAKGDLVYQASSTGETRYVKASAWEASVGGKSVQYASDVKFIFMSEDDGDITGITVTEGVTEVGSATDTTKQYNLVYVLNDDGNKIVAVVVPNDDDAGNTQNLMYIQKTTGYTSTDSKDRVALFTAYIDGEKLTNCQSNKETVESDSFYTYSKDETTGIYTISKYNKPTGKNTSVMMGDELSSNDLTAYNDYTFKSSAKVDTTTDAVLNAKAAKVIDLDTDDDYTFTTVKEMKDAIKNKTIDAKTGKAITGFKVSYVFNGSDNTGSGKIAYLFITDTESNGTSDGGSGSGTGVGSTFTTDYTVASNGRLSATINYTAANFVKDAGAQNVKADVEVYSNGAYYATIKDQSFSVGTDGKATTRVTDSNNTYPTNETLTFKIVKEMPEKVAVQYVDKSGNALTVGTGYSDLSTATAPRTLIGTAATGTIEFTVSSTKYAAGTCNYSITGLTTTQSATATVGTPVSLTTLQAKGDAYVVVTVDTASLTTKTATYGITVPAAITLSDKGVTATHDKDAAVTISAAKDTGIAANENVVINATLSAAPVDNYGYVISISKLGLSKIVTAATPTLTALGTIKVTSDVEITAADVTVTPIATLAVTNVTWDAGSIAITFNRALDKTAAEATSSYTATIASTATVASAALSADGKTVTLTVTGGVIAAADTVVLKPALIDANTDYSGNKIVTGTNDTITLTTTTPGYTIG